MAKIKNPRIEFTGTNEDFFGRTNVTEFAPDTCIIVQETHNAVLVKDGKYMETLPAGRYPVFDKKGGLFGKHKKDGDVWSVEVIYMSKTARVKVLWGTPRQFDFRDDETGVAVKVGAGGEFEVQVSNPKKFYLSLVGADKNFNLEMLRSRLSGRMLSEIEPAIAKTMREEKISYTRIAEYKTQISASLKPVINKMFEDDYGLTVFSFTLSNIVINPEYIQAIESRREEAAREAKEKASSEEDKRTAKEIAAEMERLSDKQFEREMLMRKLESEDYEKYLAVCKMIGWEPSAKTDGGRVRCPKCGNLSPEGARFCNTCGEKLVREPITCPKCKSVNLPDAKFCNNCGEKL